MKCKYLFLLSALLLLVSCGLDHDLINQQIYEESVKQNAEKKLGVTIDPNHTWSSVTQNSITITADAPLSDISKVQILTESPFFNDNAEFIAEAVVSKGQTVTLEYDWPKDLDRLIAACVDSKGHYYIKGFNPSEKSVSFTSATRNRTRGAASIPDISSVELKYENSFPSFNAGRTISANEGENKYSSWRGSHWENDRFWQPTGLGGGEWTMDRSTIFKSTDPITDEEKEELLDIFSACLYRDDAKGVRGRRDNLSTIRESNAVRFFGNHLVTDGTNPITLIPVQLASTEAKDCDIYYYYYKQGDVPSNMSEADYIKTLPKFKAIDLDLERASFSAATGIASSARDENFLRFHEYLLPYYGEPSEFEATAPMLSQQGYTTDGKFYRIRNFSDNKDHFITNGDKEDDLKDAYTENVEEQLWQIFTNNDEGKVMFYNVGGKKFLWCNNGRPEIKVINEKSLEKYTFYITDSKINPTESKTKVYIYSYNQNNCLKSDAGKMLGIGKKNSTNQYREWTFEEYTASKATAITDFALPTTYFANYIPSTHPTAKAVFDEGYRIGFVIRKDFGSTKMDLGHEKKGCLYGYGELNRQINTFGQFKSAVTDYSMKEDDPRIAMFNANGKTYLCFEEGADAQYSDVIIELGGSATSTITKRSASDPDTQDIEQFMDFPVGSGVYNFDSEPETQGIAYTMCFEDRPREADFDMNDVVIQARLINSSNGTNTIQIILVACGAQDKLILQVPGSKLFNNNEIHTLYGLYDNQYFVNTQRGGYQKPYGIFENIETRLSIQEFLKTISLKNEDMDDIIDFQSVGEYPRAIIVPLTFDYPEERSSITEAYPHFLEWVHDMNVSGKWYTLDVQAEKTFPNLFRGVKN